MTIEREKRTLAPSPPGVTLQAELSATGMTQADLAARIGLSTKHVNQIIHGAAPITPETALKLEHVLGSSARFWLGRESNYREALARASERKLLEGQTGWIRTLHASILRDRGLIPPSEDPLETLGNLLKFFRIPSFDNFNAVTGVSGSGVAFRAAAAHEADPYAVVTWLRACEVRAADITTAPYDETGFRACLHDVRALTRKPSPVDWVPELIDLCAQVGVAVVLEPSIGKTLLNGAAWWPSPDKAIIGLTGRNKRADILWFTFFHEAAHIALHSKKQAWVDITAREDMVVDGPGKVEIELEADKFAANRLVPGDYDDQLKAIATSWQSLADFAADIGVGVDVVVGRLQHLGRIPYASPLGRKVTRNEPEELAKIARQHIWASHRLPKST